MTAKSFFLYTPTQKPQLQQSPLIATHLSYLFHMHQESDHDIY